jgi:hypothetical protein
MSEEKIDRPERSDSHHLAKQTKSLYVSQIALLFLFAICVFLCVALMLSFNRPERIAVIDKSSGKTYGTVTQKYTQELMDMNLVYYSKEFCEAFYNANHTDIDGARRLAVSNMHPTLIRKLKITEDYYNDSYVKEIKQNLGTCTFDWMNAPTITKRNDPRYTTFCQFRRIVSLNGKLYETKHNVTIQWIRYKSIDPMKKPTPLFVLDFSDGDISSKEVQEQIELTTK